MDTPEFDITREKAEGLVAHINSYAGLTAHLFYDRGPYCCRIPLVPGDDENAPSLFVFVEDSESYRILSETLASGLTRDKRGWRWNGVIGGDTVSDDLADGVSFEFLERDWLGEDHLTVAKRVRALAQVLRHQRTVRASWDEPGYRRGE